MGQYNKELNIRIMCANCGHYNGSILHCKMCAGYSQWIPEPDGSDKNGNKRTGTKSRKDS